MLKRVRFLGIEKSSEISLPLGGNFFPPQARKHCRNGGPDTDSYWDHKTKRKKQNRMRGARERIKWKLKIN